MFCARCWAAVKMLPPPPKTQHSYKYAVFIAVAKSIFYPYVCTDVCIYNVM